MELRNVGIIGLGAMGGPMAERVAGAGYALRLYDIAPARTEAAAEATGGRKANGPQAVAAASDVVITMLPTGADVARTALEPGGIADGFPDGGILIDMSSSEPAGTVELAAALSERGIGMIDAPVSGGRKGAVEGTLTVMAGGDAALVEHCRPVLEAIGKRVVHTGAIGSGHALKALNNTISAAGFLIAVEAFLVGKRFGLEPETMAEVVNSSTGMNHSTRNKLARFVFSRSFDSGIRDGPHGEGSRHRARPGAGDRHRRSVRRAQPTDLGPGAAEPRARAGPHRNRPLARTARPRRAPVGR